MAHYLAHRALGLLLSLFLVTLVTFFLMHAAPGGPYDESQQPLPPAAKQNILHKYGLDQPLGAQYLVYMSHALRLDFGMSYSSPTESVVQLIGRVWVPTLILGTIVLCISFGIGIPLGILAATHAGSWLDQLVGGLAIIALTIPGFIFAVWMIYFFSINLKLLPTGGWGEPRALIMPVIVYVIAPISVITRITRTSVLGNLHTDYIRTARAKGLREYSVLLRHALRNALIPMVTALGPFVPNILTGTVLIEVTYRIPGLGRAFAASSQTRDYPLIMALMLLIALVWGITYFLTDVVYAFIDPRVRLGGVRAT